MSLQRLSVSVAVADTSIDPEALVPVFHDWIRVGAVEGLLIDVVRYAHVADGPGIVLIGHEGDYALDFADGRPWLRYTLKRDNTGEPAELVARALRRLQGAIAAAGEVGIAVDERDVVVRVYDRLHAPNTPDTAAALIPAVHAGWQSVMDDPVRVEGPLSEDARAAFAVALRPVSAVV